MIKPLNPHYSMENIPTIYDEEAMTALELAGRTTGKVNEVVEVVNKTLEELPGKIEAGVSGAVEEHIESGAFDDQLDSFVGGINRRLDNLILNSGDSTPEVVDMRVTHDGITYPTAGDASRDVMRRLVKSITNPSHPGEDDGVDPGYYSNVDGLILNDDSFCRTKYLYPCKEGALLNTVFQLGAEYLAGSIFVTCFDIDLNYLGYFRLGSGVTLPNTAFVGLSCKADVCDGTELVIMELPAVTGHEVRYARREHNIMLHQAFVSGTGAISETPDYNAVIFKTDGIKSIYTNKTLVYNAIFFNKYNQVVSNGAEYTTEGMGRRYQVPFDAVWVAMNVPTAHTDVDGNLLTYIALERLDPDGNDLNGKVVTMIGDSLVWLDGHEGDETVRGAMVGMQAELRKRGAIVNTLGYSGAPFASTSEDANDGVCSKIMMGFLFPENYPDYIIPVSDAYVFMFGTNDIRLGIPAGERGDGASTTFAGALGFLNTLMTDGHTPGAIYVTSCLFSETETRPRETVAAYHDVAQQTCADWGMCFIDLLQDSGINRSTLGQLTYDGTHPNLEGMKRIGRIIAKRLEETL